ncbi:hypothetical protein BJY00DRAFT_296893 [Aspergillus carlsbadensis]|nr:hypothetical protein BJY00DRAFT_296893 [Aspergillus carlsbadensis]
MSGMVRFDAKNLSWTNETLGSGSFGVEPPSLWAGALVYIPAGPQGMLIAFGGRNVTRIFEGENYLERSVEADWLNIYVYDIESHTWWMQRASGDPPESTRLSFCTAVSQSPGGSSFHITTYAGWSRTDGRSYENVNVLTIPNFEWIDASSVSDVTNSEKDEDRRVGRDALTGACHTYRGSQMIILGGQVREGKTPVTVGNCTEEYPPIRVLDLSTYEWRTVLDTESEYSVPTVISRVTDGVSRLG